MTGFYRVQSKIIACIGTLNVLPFIMFLLCSFFTFLPSYSYSQCEPVDALYCEDAPLMELENFCGRTTPNAAFCCTGFCGSNTAVHNPTYLKFIALDTFIQLDILVLPCVTGIALQGAIISSCPWENLNILDCHPGTGVGQMMVLKSGGITPGNEYWLLIDGSSGAVCNFLITDVTGLSVTGSTEVSLQQVVDTIYALPEELPQGSYSFAWFDCDENIVLDTTPAFVPPGSGCYCVTVRDAVTTNTFCTTVVLTSSQDVEKTKISIYPNPSHEITDINVENANARPLTVNIFDWQGRHVDQLIMSDGNYRYTWDGKVPGVYLLRITEGDRTIAFEKIVYSGR